MQNSEENGDSLHYPIACPKIELLLAGLSSLVLVFLKPGLASYGVILLGLATGVLLALWAYRDASRSGRLVVPWVVIVLFAWPLTFPFYLVWTRGLRGLLPALGVLLVFLLQQGGYFGSVIRTGRVAVKLCMKGETILAEAQKSSNQKKYTEALGYFRQARVNLKDPKGQLYDGFLDIAYYFGQISIHYSASRAAVLAKDSSTAEEFYGEFRKLRKPRSASNVVTWHLVAMQYLAVIIIKPSETAYSTLLKGDSAAHLAYLRVLLSYYDEAINLMKDNGIILKTLDSKQLELYSDELKTIKRLEDSFKESKIGSVRSILDKVQHSPRWKEAFENFIKGVALWEGQNNPRLAEQYFDRSIQIQPDFGEPYVELADIYLTYGRNDLTSDAVQKGITRIEKYGPHGLYTREEMLAEAHALNGKALYRWGMDLARHRNRRKKEKATRFFESARSELFKALKLNPKSRRVLELKKEMGLGK